MGSTTHPISIQQTFPECRRHRDKKVRRLRVAVLKGSAFNWGEGEELMCSQVSVLCVTRLCVGPTGHNPWITGSGRSKRCFFDICVDSLPSLVAGPLNYTLTAPCPEPSQAVVHFMIYTPLLGEKKSIWRKGGGTLIYFTTIRAIRLPHQSECFVPM